VTSSLSPARYVPTLTEVVRLPDREASSPVNPEWVVQQVLQRLEPKLEALVRQTVSEVLSECESASANKPLHK
jgi:hypothetical protein